MRELTFIHLKEQYLAVHEGHVQVSCFCLNEGITITDLLYFGNFSF